MMQNDSQWKSILSGMMSGDGRFKQFKKFRWYGEVDGMRIGVVIANKSAQYTSYALNKADFDGLISAKQKGFGSRVRGRGRQRRLHDPPQR